MKDEKEPREDQPETEASEPNPPDGRGPRPTDPNELAKWIVDQISDDRCDINRTK